MSSLVLQSPDGQTPVHIAFAEEADILAALMPDKSIHVWSWKAEKRQKPSTAHLGQYHLANSPNVTSPKQLAITVKGDQAKIYLLAQPLGGSRDVVTEAIIKLSTSSIDTENKIECSDIITQILVHDNSILVQTRSGRIASLNGAVIATLPEPCTSVQGLNDRTVIGLSETGRLYLNEQVLANGCSSFAIGGDFLIYTTLQHEARFVLLDSLLDSSSDSQPISPVGFTQALPTNGQNGPSEDSAHGTVQSGYARKVERGSRIVTVVPSSMSMVLQMPRGNLETISPRPLVLQIVRGHLNNKEYREAFLVCRRHRIDLNILCDHDRAAFIQDLPLFVDQIDSTEYLNLFITGLK